MNGRIKLDSKCLVREIQWPYCSSMFQFHPISQYCFFHQAKDNIRWEKQKILRKILYISLRARSCVNLGPVSCGYQFWVLYKEPSPLLWDFQVAIFNILENQIKFYIYSMGEMSTRCYICTCLLKTIKKIKWLILNPWAFC